MKNAFTLTTVHHLVEGKVVESKASTVIKLTPEDFAELEALNGVRQATKDEIAASKHADDTEDDAGEIARAAEVVAQEAEQAEADRVAAEQAEADRVAAEQAEADRKTAGGNGRGRGKPDPLS